MSGDAGHWEKGCQETLQPFTAIVGIKVVCGVINNPDNSRFVISESKSKTEQPSTLAGFPCDRVNGFKLFPWLVDISL